MNTTLFAMKGDATPHFVDSLHESGGMSKRVKEIFAETIPAGEIRRVMNSGDHSIEADFVASRKERLRSIRKEHAEYSRLHPSESGVNARIRISFRQRNAGAEVRVSHERRGTSPSAFYG